MKYFSKKVCDRRHPWQSLREHFRKQIFPQLNKFDLTQKEIQKFRRSWQGLQVSFLSVAIYFFFSCL
jgi:hypothetical protein